MLYPIKIFTLGHNQRGLTIPYKIVKKLGIKKGDIYITEIVDEKNILLKKIEI